MLFSSLEFVFLFLPLTLVGYYALIRTGLRDWLFLFLVVASLVFYSVWNPPYVLLLVASMLGNYLLGVLIHRRSLAGKSVRYTLILGVLANLAVLGWYKYAEFFAGNLSQITGETYSLPHIILPLAISFYTFQQIAYLVDISRGEVRPSGIWRYATFVIFFPQLIAGPIVHYREMMPQFFGRNLGRFALANFTIGLTIFAIGLFKKTVIADSAATFSSPIFDAVAGGETIGLLAAWKAAICYTIQLYFDFSGYSDMAIGLARMFGIRLPVNFHSPLRAPSIIEYWRRWHITLQQFIVAYMYQPLAVSLTRWAATREFGKWPMFWVTVGLPTIAIFVLVGLWHGAAWTFVVFGLMHGVYLSTNEFWRTWRRKSRRKSKPGLSSMAFYHLLTVGGVIAANVMFRAESVGDATKIWKAMLKLDQIGALPTVLPFSGAELLTEPFVFSLLVIGIVALCPNTQQIMGRYRPIIGWEKWRDVAKPLLKFEWRLTRFWAVVVGLVLFVALAFISRGRTEFIYFNF